MYIWGKLVDFEGCWRRRFLKLDSGHWILEKSRARNA
jgi:hypothetical protein